MNMADLPDDFSQRSRFEVEFPKAFGVPFDSVTSVVELTSALHDDGMSHYINTKTKDVYSHDMFKNKWLEKNKKKDEVLERLPGFNTKSWDLLHIFVSKLKKHSFE